MSIVPTHEQLEGFLYPSKKDFIEMTSSASYQEAHKHREAVLERTVLLACKARA